jgi:hypothetical protein
MSLWAAGWLKLRPVWVAWVASGAKLTFDPPRNFDMMNGIAAVELGIY